MLRARLVRIVAQLLLLLGLALPLRVFAVSLGDELILSRLGDPVEVEIEVLQWEDMDLERVQISAASREEYELFKLTWLPVLEELNFNLVGPDLDGNVRVLISSRAPLDEPFLELLLVLRWPGGSLRREYVLLFDPPGLALTATAPPVVETPAPVQPAPQPLPQAPVPEPQPQAITPIAPEPQQMVALVARESEPEPDPAAEALPGTAPALVERASAPPLTTVTPPVAEAVANNVVTPPPEQVVAVTPTPVIPPAPTPPPRPVVAEPVTEAAAAPQDESPDARTQLAIEVDMLAPQASPQNLDTTRRSYQVRSGDSLWNIARQFRPAGAGDNLYQMLLSIHDLNRSAFINGNISLLKANALLQVPNEADIAAIDAAGAEAEFDRRWEEGTQRFDAVQRGEAIPLFVNSVPEDLTLPDPVPQLPPGTEAAPANAADDGALIIVADANLPQPLQLAPEEAFDAGAMEPVNAPMTNSSAITVIPDAAPATAPSAPGQAMEPPATIAATEPAVQPVVVNVTRATLTAELESEVEAMRVRRATAEAIARQLQASLQQAQAERAAKESLTSPENLALSTAAAGLLLLLIAGTAYSLRIAAELRMQRGNRVSRSFALPAQERSRPDVPAGPLRASTERVEPRMPQMEVVELPAVADAAQAAAPEDLFARMDDMLGRAGNTSKK